MVLDINSLLGGSVQSLPFEYRCAADELSPDIKNGTIGATGKIRNYSGYILLTAAIHLKAKVICARCASDFETEFSYETEQKLTDKLENKENDEFILVENGQFDLSEYVNSSILLELPTRFLCSEDCKGLCPKCGHNLNKSPCSCDTREIDPRLAVLSEYFNKK